MIHLFNIFRKKHSTTFTNYDVKIIIKIDNDEIKKLSDQELFRNNFGERNIYELTKENHQKMIEFLYFFYKNNYSFIPFTSQLILKEIDTDLQFEMTQFDVGVIDEWKNALQETISNGKSSFCDQSSDQMNKLTLSSGNILIQSYDYEMIQSSLKSIKIINLNIFIKKFHEAYNLIEAIKEKIHQNNDKKFEEYSLKYLSTNYR